MKKQLFFPVCTAVIAAALASGCGTKDVLNSMRPSEAAAETSENTEAEEETISEDDAEEAESELYNTYIDVNNVMVDRFSDVISSYFRYVDFQEEFVPLQDDYWCLSNISTFYEHMDDANELAQQKTDKTSLDNAYLELYPVMRDLAEALDEVYDYTDMKSYLDDDYAKGKELHARIWSDYASYETLADTFINELSVVADQKRDENLERLKEEGYEATYAFTKLITTGQEIQTAIYEQEIDDSQITSLNIEALQPLYDQYVEEVQTCLNYLADTNIMEEEGYPTHSAYYSSFERNIRESKTALTDLFQRVRDQKGFESYELNSAFAADGSIENFFDTLSNIIDDYNRLINY
ncbi:DUF3829 domain-containing protein [Clostridiaceae bacterium]|jgi:hypothetical protein|nr:DUF3829 domain-containing protein [Clostridiaceae bacterium]